MLTTARTRLLHRLALDTGIPADTVTLVPVVGDDYDSWTHTFTCPDEGTARIVAAWLLHPTHPVAGVARVDGATVRAEIH